MTAEDLVKASRYSQAKGNLSIIETFFSFILLLVVVSAGVIGEIDSFFSTVAPTWVRVSVFFSVLLLLQTLLHIPLALYSTFVIEKRFGFNKTTLKTFIADQVKGTSLSLLLMVPLLGCMVWFIS
ncbi:MAG: M48 family peptidase, partial [Nitrospinota bacterium]